METQQKFQKHENFPKINFGPAEITETLPSIQIQISSPQKSIFHMHFDPI